MSGEAFVDTNLLVYAHDTQAGPKTIRAQELLAQLWRERRGVLSSWQVVVNTDSSVLRALELEQRYQISFWDAMIVQAAESAGCEALYSEDLSHGQQYGGVLVVNPFLS